MSVFFREQQRSAGGYFTSSTQIIPTRPPFATAGVPVTPATAVQKVAVMASVNLIANMPRILPECVYTGSGGKTRPVPVPAVVHDPEGTGYGLADFSYKLLSSLLLRGNAFIKPEGVDSNGRPRLARVMNPDEVTVFRNSDGTWHLVDLDGNKLDPYGAGNLTGMIHLRAFPMPGQPLGLSVVTNHARTLGLSIASEQFGADFFADGAHPSGILTTTMPIDDEKARTIKSRFTAAVRGSREPAVLGSGFDYKPIQIAPAESQFLEAQRFTAAECCRMFGPAIAEMLGYETGSSMTYQNVQSKSLHLLIYAVSPWLRTLERFLSDYLLPSPQYVQFDRNALLQMTAGDRWSVNKLRLTTGSATVNEIRAEENLPPVAWGDEPFLPGMSPAAAGDAVKADQAADGEAFQ